MQYKKKIETALLVSLILHFLIIGFIKIKPYTIPQNKEKLIDLIVYEEEKPEPKASEKKAADRIAPAVKAKELPKPEKTEPAKKVAIKEPQKKEPPKVLPEKKVFTLEERPPDVSSKKSAPKGAPSAAKADPPKEKTEPSPPNPAEIKESPAKEPLEEEPIKKAEHKEDKEDLSLLKELLRRESMKARESAKERSERKPSVGKAEDNVKITKLLPSMDRLEALEKEHTRGIGDSDMESVSLDSMDIRYVSYLDNIKLAIELAWNYPEDAARRGIQGEGVLSFTIKKDGGLDDITLINTTGSKILDDRFLRAVKMASPFPPLPENIKTKKLRIVATYRYILSIVY